jgi:spheroidene monooxygenase
VAVLLLAQALPRERFWLLSRLVRGPRALKREQGLAFARVLGSGHDGGFGLRPSFDRGGLFALFDDEAHARRFADDSAIVEAYRRRTSEMLVAVLRAASVRGSWAGASMRATAAVEPGAPIASLTRASIRPLHAPAFWRHAAPTQKALATSSGCLLLAGLGEAPLLRQATFSLWRDTAAMEAYARRGAHQAAAADAWQHHFFSESMFVRFAPLLVRGRWQGREHDYVAAPRSATGGAHG